MATVRSTAAPVHPSPPQSTLAHPSPPNSCPIRPSPPQSTLAHPSLTSQPLAAERLRPTGGTTDFWPQSFHATPIGLMLKSLFQPGTRCPSAPPFRRLCRQPQSTPVHPVSGAASTGWWLAFPVWESAVDGPVDSVLPSASVAACVRPAN